MQIADALRQHGIKNFVASAGGRMVHDLEKIKVPHITLPLKTKNPIKLYLNSLKLEKIIKENGINIVHARSRAPAWSAYWAAKRAGVKFMTTFHGTYGLGPKGIKKFYNRVMTYGQLVIAISNHIKKHITENYRINEDKIRLIHRCVDIEKFSPAAVSQERIIRAVQENNIPEDLPVRRSSPYHAYITIMYGCNNFCSYCIVPYVRGREKSRKPGDILAEFRSLVEAGYKEITLLGQNVNSYGKGLEEQIDFSDLLNLLCTVPGDYHIRFMTSHPKDASHKLIDTIAAQPKLCKHLHLPVQCGSDRLLQQMNRHYTVEQYLELIDYARKTVPGITFSSDIIVGFPGETEEDFVKTLELVRKVGYMQLFTFIYSKRTGTKAAEMPDPTPRKEKTDRMTRLLATQDEIAMALVKAQVGQTARVLVEGFGRNEGTLSGRLDNNLTVEFAADPAMLGSYATVHLTGARATVLLGEVEA